jgi:hypothetical protein
MDFGRFLFRVFAVGVLLGGAQSFAQQPMLSAKGGAEGRLTVTATVVSSVGLVVGPGGEQQIIVANAIDPRDNVSRLQQVATVQMAPAVGSSAHQKPTKEKKLAQQR